MNDQELEQLNAIHREMESHTNQYRNKCLWVSMGFFTLAALLLFWWAYPELTLYILSKVF